jgi:hypothetical protein
MLRSGFWAREKAVFRLTDIAAVEEYCAPITQRRDARLCTPRSLGQLPTVEIADLGMRIQVRVLAERRDYDVGVLLDVTGGQTVRPV